MIKEVFDFAHVLLETLVEKDEKNFSEIVGDYSAQILQLRVLELFFELFDSFYLALHI